MVGAGFLLGVLGWIGGIVPTHPSTMVLVAGGAAVLNAVAGIVTERGWHRWWLIYVLALLDALLVGVPVLWFGHGGLVAGSFIAVRPYPLAPAQPVGQLLVLL